MMCRYVYPRVLLFLTLGTGLCGRQLTAQELLRLSMEEAVEIAQENNTEVTLAKYQAANSVFLFREAKGNFLPRLTFNGDYTRNIDQQVIFLPPGLGPGGATRIGSDNNFAASVNLSVPVFSRSNTANKKYAERNFLLHSETLRGTRQEVVASVKKSYLAYLLSLAVVKVQEKGLENALENLRNIRDKLSQGVATAFDEASAQVEVTAARNNLLEAENNVVPAENELKILLRLPMETVILPDDPVSLTGEEIVIPEEGHRLLDRNSELRQQELRAALARQEIAKAKSAWFPDISVTGAYQFQSQEDHFDFSGYDWVKTSFLGLSIQYTLFNGTVTKNRVHQAVVAKQIAEIQEEFTAENNRTRFMQLVSELGNARQRVALQQENADLAAEALKLVKERFRYGRGTFLEVNNAELEYITARLNYLQAIWDYKSAYYDYELLTGKESQINVEK